MISRLRGTLLGREPERIEVATPGGVVYEVNVPRTVLERLPAAGTDVEILTVQVVREDAVALYGFVESRERELFGRLMAARGVGASTALSMLSTYAAPRLARALAEKDTAALQQVSGIGKKTAERLVVDLADRVQDLAVAPGGEGEDATGPAQEAVSALVSLGYSFTEADEAVQQVLEDGDAPESAEELIRRALASR